MKNVMLLGLCALMFVGGQAQSKNKKTAVKKRPYTAEIVQGQSFKTLLAMHLGVDEASLESNPVAVKTGTKPAPPLPESLWSYEVVSYEWVSTDGPKICELTVRQPEKSSAESYAYLLGDGSLLALSASRRAVEDLKVTTAQN